MTKKKEFTENFGKYVMVISCSDFINNVRSSFEKHSIDWSADKVKYSDFKVNYMDRLEDHLSNRSGKYFWKDKYFEKQKEYRVVALNQDSNNPLQIEIGDLTNKSLITTTDELFNNRFQFEVRFNPGTDLIRIED